MLLYAFRTHTEYFSVRDAESHELNVPAQIGRLTNLRKWCRRRKILICWNSMYHLHGIMH